MEEEQKKRKDKEDDREEIELLKELMGYGEIPQSNQSQPEVQGIKEVGGKGKVILESKKEAGVPFSQNQQDVNLQVVGQNGGGASSFRKNPGGQIGEPHRQQEQAAAPSSFPSFAEAEKIYPPQGAQEYGQGQEVHSMRGNQGNIRPQQKDPFSHNRNIMGNGNQPDLFQNDLGGMHQGKQQQPVQGQLFGGAGMQNLSDEGRRGMDANIRHEIQPLSLLGPQQQYVQPEGSGVPLYSQWQHPPSQPLNFSPAPGNNGLVPFANNNNQKAQKEHFVPSGNRWPESRQLEVEMEESSYNQPFFEQHKVQRPFDNDKGIVVEHVVEHVRASKMFDGNKFELSGVEDTDKTIREDIRLLCCRLRNAVMDGGMLFSPAMREKGEKVFVPKLKDVLYQRSKDELIGIVQEMIKKEDEGGPGGIRLLMQKFLRFLNNPTDFGEQYSFVNKEPEKFRVIHDVNADLGIELSDNRFDEEVESLMNDIVIISSAKINKSNLDEETKKNLENIQKKYEESNLLRRFSERYFEHNPGVSHANKEAVELLKRLSPNQYKGCNQKANIQGGYVFPEESWSQLSRLNDMLSRDCMFQNAELEGPFLNEIKQIAGKYIDNEVLLKEHKRMSLGARQNKRVCGFLSALERGINNMNDAKKILPYHLNINKSIQKNHADIMKDIIDDNGRNMVIYDSLENKDHVFICNYNKNLWLQVINLLGEGNKDTMRGYKNHIIRGLTEGSQSWDEEKKKRLVPYYELLYRHCGFSANRLQKVLEGSER